MLRTCYALIVTALLLPAWAPGETPSLDDIRTALDATWKDVESMSADVTMDFLFPVDDKQLPLTGTGTFHYLRAEGKDKSRQQITTKIPEPFIMEMKLDILFDGRQMHTTVEMMGQKETQVGEPSLEQGALPPGGTRLLEALGQYLNLSAQPNESIDGQPVYVLEGIPKDKTAPISKFLIYIDQALAVQRKTEIYQTDGTVGMTVLFSNLKQNTNPDPNLFVAPKK